MALQTVLLRAASEFGSEPAVEPLVPRALATAAALDYVLMLARSAAGTRIPERDAERAMHEGIARAVDDAIATTSAIARLGTPAAARFAREVARALQDALREEALQSDERTFAVIALANA